MGASTIADAADEAMTAEDFTAFMDRHGFTLDRVAAELGISRRMAAYYKREHRVPRTVALACRYIDVAEDRSPKLNAEALERWVTRVMEVGVEAGVRLPPLRPDLAAQLDRVRASEAGSAVATDNFAEHAFGASGVPDRHG